MSGYLFRFIKNAREKDYSRRKTGGLSSGEIQAAYWFLLRRVQSNVYQQEKEEIRAGQPLERSSLLIKLAPYLDYRMLCVDEPIDKGLLAIDTFHPTIFPRTEPVTELILLSLHLQRIYLSAKQLHHEARNELWIAKGRITSPRDTKRDIAARN